MSGLCRYSSSPSTVKFEIREGYSWSSERTYLSATQDKDQEALENVYQCIKLMIGNKLMQEIHNILRRDEDLVILLGGHLHPHH